MISNIATGIYTGLGVAACAGAAAGWYAYASTWPGSRVFGTALTAPPRPGEMALTFDDGPNATWTPKMLDILANNNVRATFFLLGSRAKMQPQLVQRMVRAGHLIGNHSWDHPNMARSSAEVIREQMTRTQNMLEQITGGAVKFFRPPYGARRPALFKIAEEIGLQVVLWNAMTSDWSDPSAERIALRLTNKVEAQRQAGRAANIVLHDGGHRDPAANRAASVAAAERLIERYKGAYKFVTLDAWV
ncbi:MAG TPA: polysaccharide deacetylase family protein [Terracidiphilus sp.]|nr:polysaccharide deacetylase family protein [Terracidiphilus sp.]